MLTRIKEQAQIGMIVAGLSSALLLTAYHTDAAGQTPEQDSAVAAHNGLAVATQNNPTEEEVYASYMRAICACQTRQCMLDAQEEHMAEASQSQRTTDRQKLEPFLGKARECKQRILGQADR